MLMMKNVRRKAMMGTLAPLGAALTLLLGAGVTQAVADNGASSDDRGRDESGRHDCSLRDGDHAMKSDPGTRAADLATGRLLSPGEECEWRRFEVVKLKGKVFYFGVNVLDPAHSPPYGTGVAGARVWLAEYPFTRNLNVTSRADGTWSMSVIKQVGVPLDVSFVYEKDFYPPAVEQAVFGAPLAAPWNTVVIKSNVHYIKGAMADIAIQMPDELYLSVAKGQLEAGLGQVIPGYIIQNLLVSTVGKSWASLYSFQLPHGDPVATVSMMPAQQNVYLNLPFGPIYFNESVSPDPSLAATSVDGGVLFDNLAPGTYSVTAAKAPFHYATATFRVDPTITLYISSPPHSIQGTNTSGPGLP
jgi:hypothetical protein